MSFDDDILLRLRREFSGQEKYRLFLQQLTRIEEELMKHRKLYNELIRANADLKTKNKQLSKENEELAAELGEYKATEADKKYVRMKAYRKLDRAKTMWETRFWELHRELQKLKAGQHTGNESL